MRRGEEDKGGLLTHHENNKTIREHVKMRRSMPVLRGNEQDVVILRVESHGSSPRLSDDVVNHSEFLGRILVHDGEDS